MNVASLELCKELYGLSGWDGTHSYYWKTSTNYLTNCEGEEGPLREIPAYDLGYMLRKLLPEYGKITLTHDYGHNQWWATDVVGHAVFEATTPEDAACKLAIELFKQGILTKEVI